MTDGELAVIEARCREATPGPWFVVPDPDYAGSLCIAKYEAIESSGSHWYWIASIDSIESAEDARFIAGAHDDIPALIAEVRRLRRLVGVEG